MGVFNLLRERKFLPLFLTQFCGAFNDNAFKLAMLTLISYHLSSTQHASERLQALAGVLFIAPFFLLSATAGQLADVKDKAIMARLVKCWEILLMALGAIGLRFGNIPLLMCVLTGMGVHSTFFGPIKYAILPDHLPKERLLGATGLIEGSTFIAILLGTTLGALSIGERTPQVGFAIVLILSMASFGLMASLFIPSAPAKSNDLKVDWNILRATMTMLRTVLKNRALLNPILVISWFWLIGAVVLIKLPDYTHFVLGAGTDVFALFLALFSVGIASGSLLINFLLGGRVSLKFVPFAMFLLSVFSMDLYFATPAIHYQEGTLQSLCSFVSTIRHWRIILDLYMFSFFGGMFVVPLYTFLQVEAHETARARTIAANNIINALAMVAGSLLVMALLALKLSIAFVFLFIGVVNIIIVLFSMRYFRLS